MYIDFHTHGKLAKKLPFSTVYTDWLFAEARKAGLDAVCLTEHFNTMQFSDLYGYIMKKYERRGDCFLTPQGLRIFAGMETDIAQGGHILTVGIPEEIMELNRRLEPFKEKGKFLPFDELMDLFSKYRVLVGAAHPFRAGGHIPELPFESLKRLDFVDLNGKDVAENEDLARKRTETFAEMLQIPMVGGSDTHQAVQYGCIRTEFDRTADTVEELGRMMKAGGYTVSVAESAAVQVKAAGVLKRALKEIHASGGDYVAALTQTGD